MTIRSALLIGSVIFFAMSALIYCTNEQATAFQVAKSRFLLAHPWILSCVWLIVSIGLIVTGLMNLVKMPDKAKQIPNILLGAYFLVTARYSHRYFIRMLEEVVRNPDSVRRLNGNLAFGFFGFATLLLVAAVIVGRR